MVASVRVGMTEVGIVMVGMVVGRGVDMLIVGIVGPGGTMADVLLARDGAGTLTPAGDGILATGALADGSGSGSTVGREKPSDGVSVEGMMRDECLMVGSEMLRLVEGIVRDGIASGGVLEDGSPIVELEMLRLGEGIVRDGILKDGKPPVGPEILRLEDGMTEGKLCDGIVNPTVILLTLSDATATADKLLDGRLSALTVGMLKIGSGVGFPGNVMIGRPKESTLDGGVGIASMLGAGIESDGGPVIVGSPVEGKLSGGRDRTGMIAEGRLRGPRMLKGMPDGLMLPTEKFGAEGRLTGPDWTGLGLVGGRVPKGKFTLLGLTGAIDNAGTVWLGSG